MSLENNFNLSENDLISYGAVKSNDLNEIQHAGRVFMELGKYNKESYEWNGSGRWGEVKIDPDDLDWITIEESSRFFYIIKK